MIKVTFIATDGTPVEAEGEAGTSLLEAGQAANMPLEGTCEGQMACSTCHVIVDPEWFGKIPPASDDEEDMLDLAAAVERTSRLVRLARMEGCDAASAQKGFERLFSQVPESLRKSLTYDRGSEMARHAELTHKTGVKVYFCDPHSPWQRASNENMNGLIR